MRVVILAVLFGAAAVATPAVARQAQPRAASSASAEQVASARAEADAIIRAAEADEFFENVTEDASPAVRHRGSGLVCLFEGGERSNNVRIYPSQGAGIARGDDVSCGTTLAGSAVTMYATRWPNPTTLQEQLAGAVAGMRMSVRNLRPTDQPGVSMGLGENGPRLPERQSATFLGDGQNGPVVTRVAVALHDGWVIKQRLTAPGAEPIQADLTGELVMMTTLMRLVDPNFGRNGGPAPAAPANDDGKPAQNTA